MMNIKKLLGGSMKDLAGVLESIHAHLELLLKEQKQTNETLKKIHNELEKLADNTYKIQDKT